MFKKILSVFVLIAICLSLAPTAFAKGGSSRSGSSFRSSPSRVSAPKPVAPKPVIKDAPKPVIKATPAPKTVKAVAPVKKSPSGKTLSTKSKTVGSNGYTPKFKGYRPPVGSTVYYNQHSFLDYLPWIFLFSMNSHASATVYPPPVVNGTSTVAVAPVEVKDEAVDTMYVINWIVTILLSLGLIAFIMWLINRKK